jgi:hypothetical protein
VDTAQFLDAEWKRHFTGTLAGTAALVFSTGQPVKAVGKFHLTDGRLENLPVLEQVATFTGSPQFRRMPLQDVSGDFSYDGTSVLISNFVTESKGLMRVEGDCRIAAEGAIEGIFRVGVTPQTLQWLPGSQERVFTIARNGYLWTDVKVGGTLQNLREDLSGRLVVAMKDEAVQRGSKVLENTPNAAREGVQGVLDVLVPLMR